MLSEEYKQIIKILTRKIIQKNFPGLKKDIVEKTARQIAINIHARLYGANVNGVDSPIWRDDNKLKDMMQPNVDAEVLLANGE